MSGRLRDTTITVYKVRTDRQWAEIWSEHAGRDWDYTCKWYMLDALLSNKHYRRVLNHGWIGARITIDACGEPSAVKVPKRKDRTALRNDCFYAGKGIPRYAYPVVSGYAFPLHDHAGGAWWQRPARACGRPCGASSPTTRGGPW